MMKALPLADVIDAFDRISKAHPEATVLDVQTAIAVEFGTPETVVHASLPPAWWLYLDRAHNDRKPL